MTLQVSGSSRAKPRDLSGGYVYIATNRSETLYVGSTNDLKRRMAEHRYGSKHGFTEKYNIDVLLYYEELSSLHEARAREAQLKKWSRAKKIALINTLNPQWRDLQKDPSTPLGATNGVRRA